ncbi:hypothetical protein A176_002400 [Myxococcus hansupus]|uniref:Uncharacterized protein n=1 Tax=Pseudomyxococcus hansupus TaxID=1297742 RepID=A0A0H4WV87_9BACT|nr:hypothetical protein [Myxococcus hansupus]AKQ65488.1 hypothetical protein A176_002400 [Myxococcus hansupus]
MYNHKNMNWPQALLPKMGDPTKMGYLMKFSGLGLEGGFKPITAFTPFTQEPTSGPAKEGIGDMSSDPGVKKIDCLGVIADFEWGGGAGDPIKLTVYTNSSNVTQMEDKKTKGTLKPEVETLAWWIIDYTNAAGWYEVSYPKEPELVKGKILTTDGNIALKTFAEKIELEGRGETTLIRGFSITVIPTMLELNAMHYANEPNHKGAAGWGVKLSAD